MGQRTALGAPIPTWSGWFLNAVTGAVLLWLVPRLLPVGTPWAIRFWIALVGLCFLRLFAFMDFYASSFRDGLRSREALGLPGRGEIARRFLGKALEPHRSGVLAGSDLPSRRACCAKVALSAVFGYSGLYHEFVSFMANSGYGRPFLYFMVQCLGVAIENTRRMHRRLLRGRIWLARAWTFAVVVLPVGLFVHPGFVDRYLVPTLVARGVPGLERSLNR